MILVLGNIIPNHQSPITSHQSPVTSPQSPVPSHQSPVPSHQSPVPSPQSPVTNFNILDNAPWKNTRLQIKIKIDIC
ncbi:hypothetical protein [Sphaerospermopsis reniformis]|uniref:hypothetical protein n=1 Tax=Sphaerospermopsis reniformis TaxID=531300 RepID=UPI0010F838B5|nr:hypothetical protein [Sphaerospermopsis reniformis]